MNYAIIKIILYFNGVENMIDFNAFVEKITFEGLVASFFNFKFSKIEDKNQYIEISSSYKFSKYATMTLDENVYRKNNILLSKWTGIPFELKGTRHYCIVVCDKELDFATCIYKKIQRESLNISDKKFEKTLLFSLMGLRGSLDPKINYFSVDIPRGIQDKQYLDYVFRLLTNLSDMRQLNLNFRELQKQFTDDNIKRNTQIRINLKWFLSKINYDLSKINIYKDNILKSLKTEISNKKESSKILDNFIERLMIYQNNILRNKLSQGEIEEIRKSLGFNKQLIDNNKVRSSSLVRYAKNLYPEECVCCKDEFKISDRTFKCRDDNRYYLEIHHVISFSSDNRGDQIDNLVKLCPACHRALSKNRASEKYQRNLILKIIKNSESAQQYVSNLIDNPTLENMINYVYDKLR